MPLDPHIGFVDPPGERTWRAPRGHFGRPYRIQANTAARSFGANWRTVAALKMSVIRKASSAHFFIRNDGDTPN